MDISSSIPKKGAIMISAITLSVAKVSKMFSHGGSRKLDEINAFIIDDKEALFYIEEPVKEKERKTVRYVTEYPRMLDVLIEMFKRIDGESEPYKFE